MPLEATRRWQERHFHDIIKSHAHQVGGSQIRKKKKKNCITEVLPHLASGGGIPEAFAFEVQWGLSAGPQGWRKQTSLLQEAYKVSCTLGPSTKQELHRSWRPTVTHGGAGREAPVAEAPENTDRRELS